MMDKIDNDIKNKEDVKKYLEDIESKFKWFYDAFTRIVDNKCSMHIIVRVKNGLNIPDRKDVNNPDWFIRDIFDKANQIYINTTLEGLFEYWFIFKDLE